MPQDNIPWAHANNNYRIIKRIILLCCVFIISLIDVLLGIVDFYILLIPLVILQTFQIWILLNNRAAFSRNVEFGLILRDSIIWSFYFFAILIELCSDISDFTFCIILFLTIPGIAVSIYKLK